MSRLPGLSFSPLRTVSLCSFSRFCFSGYSLSFLCSFLFTSSSTSGFLLFLSASFHLFLLASPTLSAFDVFGSSGIFSSLLHCFLLESSSTSAFLVLSDLFSPGGGKFSDGPPASTMTISSSCLAFDFRLRSRLDFSGDASSAPTSTISSSSSRPRDLLCFSDLLLDSLPGVMPSIFAAFADISGGGETNPLSTTECRLELVLPEVLDLRRGGAAPNMLVNPLDIGGLSALSDEE